MLYKTIEVKIWGDPHLRELSDQGKLLFVYLKSNRQSHYSGLFELELPTLLAQLKWSETKFLKVMAEISNKPFVMYDRISNLFFVVNALSYNLKYGNQKNLIKGITKHLSTFHKSTLLNSFHNKYKDLGYAIPMGYEWVNDPSNTVTVTNTVTDIVVIEKSEINIIKETRTELFEKLWLIYPPRRGRKIGKPQALEKFLKMKDEDIPLLVKAVHNLESDTDTLPKDFHRFIKDRNGEPYRDWVEVAEPERNKGIDKYRRAGEKLSRGNQES